eukprot:258827-Pyramimonas_sp.AAC.1
MYVHLCLRVNTDIYVAGPSRLRVNINIYVVDPGQAAWLPRKVAGGCDHMSPSSFCTAPWYAHASLPQKNSTIGRDSVRLFPFEWGIAA